MSDRNLLVKILISLYHCIKSWLMPILIDDVSAIKKFYFEKSNGRSLNLDFPETFSEKLQWYKLNVRIPLMEKCANKYLVRDYIQSKGLGYILNDIYFCHSSVKDIDLDLLPKSFVLKATHGSGFNIIVKDKNKVNWVLSKILLWTWLHQNIAWSGREWVYKNMPRGIVAEKYLEDISGGLVDYKFYCFNGMPKFLQVEIGRFDKNNIRNFYDMEWNLLPFGKGIPHNPNCVIDRPEMFDEMKEISKNLCKDFQFVRVDLYQANNRIYFGELTFFPAGGTPNFIPESYDNVIGKMWELDKF